MLKLHLGAFDCSIDGWVNTDITPHIWVSRIPGLAFALKLAGKMDEARYAQHRDGVFRQLRYVDLTRPLPFPGNSVSAVFSSHVFEHLFSDEVGRLIAEIHRVLAPGGVCRVVVPDLDKIVAGYDRERPEQFLLEIFEIGERKKIRTGHHTGFTGPHISRLFTECGFSAATICAYQQGDCPDVEKLDNRPESLFFEARK